MTTISILYPYRKEGRFDFEYYVNNHMPTSIRLLGAHPGFLGVSVERGLGGAAPGSDPTFVAACHYRFESPDAFTAAFDPHAAELQADRARYTDVAPVIQANEVVITR